MKRRWIVLLIAILLIGVLVGWNIIARHSQQPRFQTAVVEKGTIVSSVQASGKVLASKSFDITTNASGVVKRVVVEDGETVTKGQKIAEIELDAKGQQQSAQSWASYLAAKNTVDGANATRFTLQSDMFTKWDTFRKLAESSKYDTPGERALPEFHSAEKDWLAAEAKFKNQESVLSQANAAVSSAWLSYQLVSSVITSPASGMVENLTAVEGRIFEATSPHRIATIQKGGQPLVSIDLSEVDIPTVKVGQKVTVTFDSFPGKTAKGMVTTVDRMGGVTNNVTHYPVTVSLDTDTPNIFPNRSLEATIIRESKTDVLLAPSAAIVSEGDTSFARVVRDGREVRVQVRIGLSSETQVEIISGLAEGESVIIGSIQPTSFQQRGQSPFSRFGGGGVLRR